MRFARCIHQEESGVFHVDVHYLDDADATRDFLESSFSSLQYDRTELASGGERFTFDRGTTLGQVRAALSRADNLCGGPRTTLLSLAALAFLALGMIGLVLGIAGQPVLLIPGTILIGSSTIALAVQQTRPRSG